MGSPLVEDTRTIGVDDYDGVVAVVCDGVDETG